MLAIFLSTFLSLKALAADYYNVSNSTTVDITEHGVCKRVFNNSGSSIFIPTKTQPEWQSFYTNPPSGVAAPNCPGVTISTVSGSISEAGTQATFTIVLDAAPSANVTFNISSNDTTEATVSPSSVTFTTGNWSTPQTITVTGVDDAVIDGSVPVTIVTSTGSSSDPAYSGFNPSDVALTNADNDTAIAIVLTPVTGNTAETGSTATFTVQLGSAPSNDVTIGLSSSDTSEGTVSPSSLTFTSGNWGTPQTVTITGVNDALVDGNQNYTIITAAATSSDSNYNGLNANDVALVNYDDDSVGITVSAVSGNTAETGTTAYFTVVLNSPPSANVTIGISSSDTTEGTVSTSSLVFTTANWSTPQTVTITGVDDALQDGNQNYNIITAAATSSDSNYNGLNPANISLTNLDNDTVGITISTISNNTTEAGTTATFTVVLTSQPSADVTIPISSSDTTEGTVSTSSLTFTSSNWYLVQTVTVTGVNDALADGPQSYYAVIGATTSSDTNYNGLNPADVSVTNLDDDSVGITVSSISGNTTEYGGTASFTVRLNSAPSANVTIGISSNDTTEGTVSPSSLTFTTSNWFTEQTVIVTGVNDASADGNQVYSIITAAATSSDSNYNGLNASDVSVTNVDNDSVGIVITPLTGLEVSETGTQASFQMSLGTAPTANVTIGLTSSDLTEMTVSTSSVTFTPDNWSSPQTIYVTGVDDGTADGNVLSYVQTAAATSSDSNYNGLNANDVSVTTTDNDQIGFLISPASSMQNRLTVSETGTQVTLSMRLTSQPTANVTIPISSSDTTEATVSVSSLVFTPDNWNVYQSFVATGADDALTDGTRNYNISTGTVTSTDTNYNGLNPENWDMQTLDDDEPGVIISTPSYHSSSNRFVVTEWASSKTYQLRMTSQPTANVTISFTSSDTTEVTVSPSSLTFTSANWNNPQTVTITGVDDGLSDGNIDSQINGSASSTDTNYNGITVPSAYVRTYDNDTKQIIVDPITDNTIEQTMLVVNESGTTAQFSVVLGAAPSANVTVPFATTDSTEGVSNVTQLVFTPANWNAPQYVTVTGVDDTANDNNKNFRIDFTAATSSDTSYNGQIATDVYVQCIDDD